MSTLPGTVLLEGSVHAAGGAKFVKISPPCDPPYHALFGLYLDASSYKDLFFFRPPAALCTYARRAVVFKSGGSVGQWAAATTTWGSGRAL